MAIERIECQAADAVLVLDTHIDYRGPTGAVEAPVAQLVDEHGKPFLPRSIAWGSKPLAEWLSGGGLRNLKPGAQGEVQLKVPVAGASGALAVEFGDIAAFAITRRKAKGFCESVLPIDRIQAPRARAASELDAAQLRFAVHRARYPCRSGLVAAEYPPYLPRQLLVFGHGFLPNARSVELPMGRAPAQAYAYSGPDNMVAVEQAARTRLLSDFPEYKRHFVFNWGSQKSVSGNEMYSFGIYELRACPK